MPQNLTERKNSLEQLFREKVKHLQELENVKKDLSTELLLLKGKMDLVDEMIKEEQKNNQEIPKAEKKEEEPKKDPKAEKEAGERA